MSGPAREVDEELLNATLDPNSLRMCVSTFKKELASSKQQTLALQELLSNTEKNMNRTKSEVTKLKDEISILNRVNLKLKEIKTCHEEDMRMFRQRIEELEEENRRDKKKGNTSLQEEASNSCESDISMGTSQKKSPVSSQILALQRKRDGLNIFRKSPKVVNLQSVSKRILGFSHKAEEETGKVYNGLGGFSKCDDFNFSNRDKFKYLLKKKNLSASAGSAAKKLKADPTNMRLDSFFTK